MTKYILTLVIVLLLGGTWASTFATSKDQVEQTKPRKQTKSKKFKKKKAVKSKMGGSHKDPAYK